MRKSVVILASLRADFDVVDLEAVDMHDWKHGPGLVRMDIFVGMPCATELITKGVGDEREEMDFRLQ